MYRLQRFLRLCPEYVLSVPCCRWVRVRFRPFTQQAHKPAVKSVPMMIFAKSLTPREWNDQCLRMTSVGRYPPSSTRIQSLRCKRYMTLIESISVRALLINAFGCIFHVTRSLPPPANQPPPPKGRSKCKICLLVWPPRHCSLPRRCLRKTEQIVSFAAAPIWCNLVHLK